MYSKKINQLATNLNPQSTDLIAIGDAETGQLKTTTYNLLSGVSSDGVISGGIVTWTGTGLVFNISACVYYLNGVRYSSPFSTKTLAAADPTNPRIDVFAVNTSGQVEVIQGTPASNPVEPEGDTPTTLGLTNVTINAGATTPNGVSRDLIYDENVESWTKTFTQSASSVNYADTSFAYTGTKSILVTMGFGYVFLSFSKATALDISNFKSISFAIRLNTAWTSNQILGISFYDGLNLVSNFYQLTKTNTVGFNRNLAGSWQLITIPLDGTIMKFKSNLFTTVRIQTQNAAATYRLDTIQLNGGINNPTGGGTTSANSFGFVNGSTGSAASTQATDTLNVVGTGLATTSASGKTLTIAVPQPTISLTGAVTGSGTSSITTTLANSIVGISNLSATGTPSATTYLRGDNTWATVSGAMAIGGSITSATAGSVLFAGVGGILQQDNANFFWDDTNNRLGIGTNAPAYRIDAVSSANEQTMIRVQNTSTGNNAFATLAAFSNAGAFTVQAFGSGITIDAPNFIYPSSAKFRSSAGLSQGMFFLTGTNAPMVFGTQDTERLRITGAGRLLIGTTTESTFLLDVNGTTRVSGKLSVNTPTAASAVMEVTSTTQGFLPPRMTTTQKNAIGTPAAGLVVYDTTTNKLCCYNGTTWNDLF